MAKPVTPQEMFDLWQKMVNPSAYPLQSLMFPVLDAKEIQKKISELDVVEHWLRANVNMIQLTKKTLQYQLALVKGGEKAQEVFAARDRPAPPQEPTAAAEDAQEAQGAAAEPPNPALWAWNMMAQAGKTAMESAAGKAAARPAKPARKRRKTPPA